VVPGVSRLAGLQVELSKKPGKDLNGLITITPMLASPAATLTSLLRPSTGGRGAITPGI